MNKVKLKGKVIKGLTWSFFDLMAKHGIQLIIQIILARLLLPEHFGLIGMVLIFIALANTFVNSGLDQALIREKDLKQEDYTTVFYFNVGAALLVYFGIYISAPIIAEFYHEPQIINILRTIMLVIIINAFGVVQRVILIRNLNFKSQMLISLLSSVISGIAAIILALNNFGVWSLVFQRIIMQGTEVLALSMIIRWVPSLKFSIKLFKYYIQFGYRILLSGLIDTFYKNIYLVIVGKLYPANQLGYLTNATKLRDVSTNTISQTIQKVTYPALSSLKDDDSQLFKGYRKVLRFTAFVFFPFIAGITAIAPNLITLLLGEKWEASVIYFQLLCISSMLYPIHAINLNILKVKNRADLFLYLEIAKKAVLTFLILLAIIYGDSIEALLFVFIIQSYLALIINTFYSGREISYPLIKQVKDMLPSYLNSIIMALIVYILFKDITGIVVINILIQILIGVCIYTLLAYLFKQKELRGLFDLIKVYKKGE